MDIGIVASRYAKALLRFAMENKEEDVVYEEMKRLDENFRSTPELLSTLQNPILKDEQKVSLICLAATLAEKSEVTATTTRFVELMVDKKRNNLVHFIATSFIRLYHNEKNVAKASLTVASSISSATSARIQQIVEARTGKSVLFEIKKNPSIEGGFVLEYEDFRIDASLRGQFQKIRRELGVTSQ